MPESGDVAATNTDLRSEEVQLLFEDDLDMGEDLNEYSFSAEPADALAGLTSAQKVGRLDLNALKSRLGYSRSCNLLISIRFQALPASLSLSSLRPNQRWCFPKRTIQRSQ